MKKIVLFLLCFLALAAFSACSGKSGENGSDGSNGKSAYDIAVEQGFVGTESEWLESLKPVSITNVTVDYMGRVVITLSDGTVHEIEVTDTSCTHDFDVTVAAPTCGEDGYTKFTCKKCEYSYSNNKVEMTGHRFFERYCAFCGAEEQFGEIDYDTSWYDSSKYAFEISTKEQLAGVAYLVNTGVENFANKPITLTASIDLGSAEWTPIGTEENPFAGTLDGRGFTISNLKLNKDTDNVGFFGYSLGEIKNVDFKGANVTVTGYHKNVGIAVGYSTKAISGITTAGFVNAPDSDHVGGVVGKCDNYVDKCASSAEVNGSDCVGGIAGNVFWLSSKSYSALSNSGNVTGKIYVGGIFGSMNVTYTNTAAYTVKMSNIANSGEIIGGDYTGGLFGLMKMLNGSTYMDFKAEDLRNSGNVSGGYYVGGLLGFLNSSDNSYVKDSSSSAKIVGKAYVGGLIGFCDFATLADSSNEGTTVVATNFSSVFVPGATPDGGVYAYLGGYVGSGDDVSGCINNAEIVYNLEGVGVGGIAGKLTGGITDCSNNGNIKSVGSWVGGIVGIAHLRSSGITLSNLTNTGRIEGKNLVGGIIGYAVREFSYYGHEVVYMNDLMNSGNVFGKNDTAGIIGYLRLRCSDGYGSCVMTASNHTNSGNISGVENVGELYGRVHSHGTSTLNVYSVLGQVVKNGDTMVGEYLAGKYESGSITITN